ncbi:maturase K [Striga asiatica]|uniref:Maturase K n=1 Tax=Striga asiatica TaxID=4170 RepID=A0A5A7QF81_STRAF|nr:maturase K [Striga asiatica]
MQRSNVCSPKCTPNRPMIENVKVVAQHVPSCDQLADIFNKPLSFQFFTQLRISLGVCVITSLELREPVKQTHNMQRSNVLQSKVHSKAAHAAHGYFQLLNYSVYMEFM